MSIKQRIVMPDFEADQQDAMKKTDNIQSLADQVERLEGMQHQLQIQEDAIKEKKKQIEDHFSRSEKSVEVLNLKRGKVLPILKKDVESHLINLGMPTAPTNISAF